MATTPAPQMRRSASLTAPPRSAGGLQVQGFRVLGFRGWGLGFRVQGLVFRVQGLGFRAFRV